MIKLINANITRLKKSKLFHVFSLSLIIVTLYLIFNQYLEYKKYHTLIEFDSLFSFFLIFIGLSPKVILAETGGRENNSKPKTVDITMDSITEGMKNVNNVTGVENSRVAQILNSVIKLIQVAGTGVSVIILTLLGIKYMLASSSEKAEIKKMAMPIVIGCVLLFAAVNLVAIIAGIGSGL